MVGLHKLYTNTIIVLVVLGIEPRAWHGFNKEHLFCSCICHVSMAWQTQLSSVLLTDRCVWFGGYDWEHL
jgi:hypothetical protein